MAGLGMHGMATSTVDLISTDISSIPLFHAAVAASSSFLPAAAAAAAGDAGGGELSP